ncbi:MAG TPA: cation diffusion facilitator family transporter [Jiangellaceae bacterium]|jgi:cation diffusion facilitator family transporter
MGHAHATAGGAYRKRLLLALIVALGVLVAQLVGAWISGSLALLADAGHVLADAGGVALALVATTLAQRPPSARRTFGWQRLEILAAAVNAILLLGVAGFVLVEGLRRLRDTPVVEPVPMLVVAVVGLAANGTAMALLHRGQRESLNIRGAYLEVLADLLGSVAVVVAAVVMLATGWYEADPVASILIGLFILPRTWMLLREALDVLLEATPRDVDLAEVRRHMIEVDGVLDVHDLHAWTITSGLPVLSAHVVVSERALADGHGGVVLNRLGSCLSSHFDVEHSTFQLEAAGHRAHEGVTHD